MPTLKLTDEQFKQIKAILDKNGFEVKGQTEPTHEKLQELYKHLESALDIIYELTNREISDEINTQMYKTIDPIQTFLSILYKDPNIQSFF